ncbi:DUF4167 domain-containing protein [Devosia sp. YIM 151766]|uniref:DUF4167 domain-containing protein n=1 Tax=Devosia sp. YIM 151766 TaxID=3017325 RepID=UPI00255C4F6B|nr:DUF4167 domain-containing protein [Devosia sp. YIM 151766]WIY52532.1 DUF4167 domain-containing protein [Devosia sp. YIM 151766]
MRPNQNKNRQRGRNGGRKHVNPLSRNYESNGPDVKVRGNAAHVAEKYLQLARDAQSSGDSVMAENYLQHAEHYFRIVSSAQQALNPREGQVSEEVDFDDDVSDVNSRFSSPQPAQPVQQSNENEGETAEAPAPQPAEEGEAAPADGEQTARKPRERRPRRRRPAGGEGAADPAEAPQPDTPELPAFLTGSAAE